MVRLYVSWSRLAYDRDILEVIAGVIDDFLIGLWNVQRVSLSMRVVFIYLVYDVDGDVDFIGDNESTPLGGVTIIVMSYILLNLDRDEGNDYRCSKTWVYYRVYFQISAEFMSRLGRKDSKDNDWKWGKAMIGWTALNA